KQLDEKKDRYSRSAVELFRLFPDARERFRLSTAARMSASFPYVSPAVELPTIPSRRVVDAGYYDVYGVNVAAMWLYHHRKWLRDNTSGVVLVQIRDWASHSGRRRLVVDEDSDDPNVLKRTWSEGLQWLTSPPEGANVARSAVNAFRNDEQLQFLSDWFDENG